MNNDSGNNGAQMPDERLIAAYRNASDETVPEHLDARVLHDARTAAQASAKVGWNSIFMRPLAFAALFVISLTMVLQLNDDYAPAIVDGSSTADLPATDTGGRIPVQAGGIADPSGSRQIASAAASSAERIRVATEQGNHHPNQRPNNSASSSTPDDGKSPAGTDSNACNETETGSPESWLACIDELEKNGRADDALREEQRMRDTFPDFRP